LKFREISSFEFLYQARRVRTWLYFAVLFVVAYQLKRTAGSGDILITSPYENAQETILTVLLWVRMALPWPAVRRRCGTSDEDDPLVYTIHQQVRLLGGRISAAFVLNA
jgi:hypothetical protein